MLLRLLRRQISVYKYFSGAGKVGKIPLRCRKGVFKYCPGFSGAVEVSDKYIYIKRRRSIQIHFPAPEKPGKYLKTPFRRRRSVYTHLSGAGEAGEPREVFIYPGLNLTKGQ